MSLLWSLHAVAHSYNHENTYWPFPRIDRESMFKPNKWLITAGIITHLELDLCLNEAGRKIQNWIISQPPFFVFLHIGQVFISYQTQLHKLLDCFGLLDCSWKENLMIWHKNWKDDPKQVVLEMIPETVIKLGCCSVAVQMNTCDIKKNIQAQAHYEAEAGQMFRSKSCIEVWDDLACDVRYFNA